MCAHTQEGEGLVVPVTERACASIRGEDTYVCTFEAIIGFHHASLVCLITRKMVPIPRRASSFLVVVFIHVNRKEEEEGETEQFTKGCNILHRLQVYHLTVTFIIHNKYTSTLYLYTYMHIPIITIALIIMPFIDRINIRYKLLGTYI